MVMRLQPEDLADEWIEGDIGDRFAYLTTSLEVWAYGLEDSEHLRMLVVKAMPCCKEGLGGTLWTEEYLCPKVS
jgi:hypothetical protein